MLELLVNTATFPGVVVHEYAHIVAARSRGLRVLDARLFEPFANPAGYVRHTPARGNADALVVGLSPFVVNTALAVAVALLTVPAFELGPWTLLGVLWLAWSLALHAPPSLDDMGDVSGPASVALAPLKVLKMAEVVGAGYLFATAVVTAGAIASLAVFIDAATAIAAATQLVEAVPDVGPISTR